MKNIFRIEKSLVVGGLAIMLAALLWSLDGTFIRPKFYTLPASLVVFLEHALGFIVLCPFIIIGWRKIKLLRKKDWLAIAWISFFGGLFGTIMITKAFFAAISGEVTFATVVILQKLQPVFALVMARLILGEKLRRGFYPWAAVAIVAAYFLSIGKNGLAFSSLELLNQAAVFAVLAAFAFGSSTVFGKRVVSHLDFKTTAALRFAFTSLMALVLIFATGDLLKADQISNLQWRYLVMIVFSSGAVAMFIYYWGLKRVKASLATIYELFWPLSAVILDYLINRNTLSPVQIISSVILLFVFFKIIKEGKVKPFEFVAQVTVGQGRGQRMGFPTINLNKVDLDFDYGVYLVEADFSGGRGLADQIYRGLMHYGTKDTFGEAASLELCLKEAAPAPLGSQVKIKIINKIREIKKFNNAEELKKQLNQDLTYL